MSLGKWLTDMIGGGPALQPVPVHQVTPAQALAQSRQLAARTMTPEIQERLARAFEVQAARQQIDRQLRDSAGRQNLADAMRHMMRDK